MFRSIYRMLAPSALALCLVFNAGTASASMITLTGVDLLSVPGVTFPETQPFADNSSIRFNAGPDFGGNAEVLLRIPLSVLGQSLSGRPLDVMVSFELTRLTSDWDPHIVISNGSEMLGVAVADNAGGQGLEARFVDQGNLGQRDVSLVEMFSGAGFPNVGDSLSVSVTFSLPDLASANVGVEFLSGIGNFTESFDSSSPLEIVLLRDDDHNEIVQVNSVTLSALPITKVPEPSTFAIFAIGFAGLGFMMRRRTA